MSRMCVTSLRVAVVAVLLLAGSTSAQVTVLATGSGTNSGTTYTSADLGGFVPPAGTDKLVVTLNDESNGFVSGATYNGATMTRVLDKIGNRYVTFFYLDYDSAPTAGNLVLSNTDNSGVSIFALQGTADGYCAAGSAINATTIDFDALFDGSFVAVGLTADNPSPGTGQVVPPLIPMLEDTIIGTAMCVSGYTNNVAAGTNTYAFTNVTGSGPSIGAIAFAALGADDVPPGLLSTSASDDVGNPTNSMLTDSVLSLTFDEAVFPGSGDILLMESGGGTSQSYNVTNAYQLSFVGNTLTITPDILNPSTSYYVQIQHGVIEDGSGNTTNYPDSALTVATGPWLSLALDPQTVYSTNDLRGFDPSEYDKLVVIAMAERSTFPSSAMWGSSNLTLVASNKTSSGNQSVVMWYGDGPFSGPEILTVGGGGYSISLLGLQGTDPGVVAFTNVSSESVDFLTTSDESFVVAGYNHNSGTPVANVPLDTYFSRPTPNAYGASGAVANTNKGLQTFSFTPVNNPSMVIAEFLITPPPAGTVLVIR